MTFHKELQERENSIIKNYRDYEENKQSEIDIELKNIADKERNTQ